MVVPLMAVKKKVLLQKSQLLSERKILFSPPKPIVPFTILMVSWWQNDTFRGLICLIDRRLS